MADMRAAVADIDEAMVFVIPPPVIQGIGSGGFRMMIQDRGASRLSRRCRARPSRFMGQAGQTPGLANVFTLYNTATPRVYADIDRTKADMLGVPPSAVFEALQVYLGSAYVNDFNLLGRTYRVTAQADSRFRDDASDIAQLKTRSTSGAMVPIGSIATFEDRTGPYRVTRYNLFPAVEMDGEPAPGTRPARRWPRWSRSPRALPPGFKDRMDRHRLPAEGGGQYRGHRLRAGGGVRLPRPRRPVRKPDPADRGDPDRADDAASGDGSA